MTIDGINVFFTYTLDDMPEVNQKGADPKLLYKKEGSTVWISRAPGKHSFYAALFNTSDHPEKVSVSFSSLGLRGKINVRDLWKQKDMGKFRKQYKAVIHPHGTVLVGLSSE